MVVPDSITPVEGWKSFDLVNGELRSPNYPLIWTVEKPAEAGCENKQFTYSWEVTSEKPPEVEEDVTYFGPTGPIGPTGPTGITPPGTMLMHYFHLSPPPPPMPKTLLPPGKYWSLEQGMVSHQAPKSGCSCGIYIAKNPEATAGYGPIIGKVKGWGTTVQHSGGWRVQYAYPSELYAHTVEQALELAAYGVPVILKEDVDDIGIRSVMTINSDVDSLEYSRLTRKIVAIASWGIPLLMVGLTAVQGALLYSHPGVFQTVALATTAMLTGFSFGMKVGVHIGDGSA